MWFRVVCLSGQKAKDHILRHTSLRFSWNFKRQGVWLKNRYLVNWYNDVRNGGGRKSLQNHKRIRTDKNSEGWNKNPCIFVRFIVGAWLPGPVPAKEPEWKGDNKIANKSYFFEKALRETKRKIKANANMTDLKYHLFIRFNYCTYYFCYFITLLPRTYPLPTFRF